MVQLNSKLKSPQTYGTSLISQDAMLAMILARKACQAYWFRFKVHPRDELHERMVQ